MLTVVSDTHGTDDHRLSGRTLEAVREASFVVHAGDFFTEAVLDAFLAENGSFAGVTGNNDHSGVRERLPSQRVVEAAGIRLVVVHGHEHDETALSLLARQEEADVVVIGHSHRPELLASFGCLVVNPGSYADPRRYQPAHAELVDTGGGVRVRLCAPDGTVITEVCQ